MQKYENKKLTIDVSDGKANYSQRNNNYSHTLITLGSKTVNDVSASTMCNVTSICQTLDYNGFVFPEGKYDQPEDNLAEFIMTSKEVDDYYRTHAPVLYNDYIARKTHKDANGKIVVDYYTPNEVHCVLAYAVNKWLGCTADTFKENVPIWDIIEELIEGRSCVISGIFNNLNHIVSLVGCEWNFKEDLKNKDLSYMIEGLKRNKTLPSKFIIDDPYGKWNAPKGYNSGLSGNNSELTKDEFIKMIKPVGNSMVKMAHIISSGAATI